MQRKNLRKTTNHIDKSVKLIDYNLKSTNNLGNTEKLLNQGSSYKLNLNSLKSNNASVRNLTNLIGLGVKKELSAKKDEFQEANEDFQRNTIKKSTLDINFKFNHDLRKLTASKKDALPVFNPVQPNQKSIMNKNKVKLIDMKVTGAAYLTQLQPSNPVYTNDRLKNMNFNDAEEYAYPKIGQENNNFRKRNKDNQIGFNDLKTASSEINTIDERTTHRLPQNNTFQTNQYNKTNDSSNDVIKMKPFNQGTTYSTINSIKEVENRNDILLLNNQKNVSPSNKFNLKKLFQKNEVNSNNNENNNYNPSNKNQTLNNILDIKTKKFNVKDEIIEEHSKKESAFDLNNRSSSYSSKHSLNSQLQSKNQNHSEKFNLKSNFLKNSKVENISSISPGKNSLNLITEENIQTENSKKTKDNIIIAKVSKSKKESMTNYPVSKKSSVINSNISVSPSQKISNINVNKSDLLNQVEKIKISKQTEKIQQAVNIDHNLQTEMQKFNLLKTVAVVNENLDMSSGYLNKTQTKVNNNNASNVEDDFIQKKINYDLRSFTDLKTFLVEHNVKQERLLESCIGNISIDSLLDNAKLYYEKQDDLGDDHLGMKLHEAQAKNKNNNKKNLNTVKNVIITDTVKSSSSSDSKSSSSSKDSKNSKSKKSGSKSDKQSSKSEVDSIKSQNKPNENKKTNIKEKVNTTTESFDVKKTKKKKNFLFCCF